jgi:hypothetical protein
MESLKNYALAISGAISWAARVAPPEATGECATVDRSRCRICSRV